MCLVLACGKESGTEDVDVEARDLSDLYGAWVLKSGDFISVGGDTTIYSQNISFVRNGNFSEELDCNYDYNWNKQDTTMYGNWSYENGRLVINDWNGNVFDNTYAIEKLTADTLTLSCGTRAMTYVRKGDEFKGAASELVGKWQYVGGDEKSYISASESGSFRIVEHIGGMYFQGTYNTRSYKYAVEDNIAVLTPTAGVISELTIQKWTINFVNDKYVRFNDAEVLYMAE